MIVFQKEFGHLSNLYLTCTSLHFSRTHIMPGTGFVKERTKGDSISAPTL